MFQLFSSLPTRDSNKILKLELNYKGNSDLINFKYHYLIANIVQNYFK
jgi:hypothetical protein